MIGRIGLSLLVSVGCGSAVVPSVDRTEPGPTPPQARQGAVSSVPGAMPVVSEEIRARRFKDLWAHLMAAHEAFADRRHQEAMELYALAKERGSRADWLEDMVGFAKEHQRLSTGGAGTHRVAVIFVTKRRVIGTDGAVGEVEDVTDEQQRQWKIYMRLVSALLEVFSRGRLSFELSFVEATATYPERHDLHPANPDHLDLEEYFFDSVREVDSFFTLSNTVSPARGLARRYPIINAAVYGPTRGMTTLNARSHGWLVALHEFFHTIEFAAQISPAHGFRDEERKSFPEWKGEREYDYYRWHLRTTIPQRGWDLLAFHRRYPAAVDPARTRAYQELRLAYRDIGFEKRRWAIATADRARASKDREARLRDYRAALEGSPYLPSAIEGLLRERGALSAAEVAELERRLAVVRDASAVR